MGLLRTLAPLKLLGGSAQMLSVTFVADIKVDDSNGYRVEAADFVGRKPLGGMQSTINQH